MNKLIKSVVFMATIAGMSSVTSNANAVIDSVTGTGTLNNAGDTINGVVDLGSSTVSYTLELDEITGTFDSGINWNGTGNSVASPNPGFSFSKSSNTSLTDTWTATMSFSQPVTFDFIQSVGLGGNSQNNPVSQFDISWLDATSSPVISDSDNQLQGESTTVGLAEFSIGGIVFNNATSWSVAGPTASEVTITWSANSEGFLGEEWITINGDSFENSAAVPFEFSPTLGLLGVGSIFSISRLRKNLANRKSLDKLS